MFQIYNIVFMFHFVFFCTKLPTWKQNEIKFTEAFPSLVKATVNGFIAVLMQLLQPTAIQTILLTIDFNTSISFSQRIFGNTFIRTKLLSGYVFNSQSHVDLVRIIHSL